MSSLNDLWLACTAGGFVLGYVVARLDAIYSVLRRQPTQEGYVRLEQRGSVFAPVAGARRTQPTPTAQPIAIDASTVVTKIDTAGIERGSGLELGTTTAQQDALQESVSKLASLKGR